MKLQLENPGSSRDLGSLPEATMGDDDSSESVVPTARGVAPPPARQEDLKVLRTGLVGNRTSDRPVRSELLPGAGRLRRVVREIGTQLEAARIAQVSVQQIRRYVSGRNPPPTSVVTRLANASGYTVAWILTGEGPRMAAQAELALQRRLQLACDRIGTLSEAADSIGLTEKRLRDLLTEEDPTIWPLIALSEASDTNLLWLATGDGPMTGAPVPATTPTPARGTVQDEPEALEIGRAVLTLLRAFKKA